MPAYDPKANRPVPLDSDDAPAIDALIASVDESTAPDPEPEPEPAPAPAARPAPIPSAPAAVAASSNDSGGLPKPLVIGVAAATVLGLMVAWKRHR